MKKITLKAGSRDTLVPGKKMIKVELYGFGVANQHLAVEEVELNRAINEARGATLIDLTVDGDKKIPVLVKEIQRNPLKGNLVHVDFLAVNEDKKVLVALELTPVGVSRAITQLGAALVKNLQTLKVECLPKDMVSGIEVDISGLNTAKDVVRVQDLTLPDGFTVKNSPRDVVFSLAASRKGRSEASSGGEAPAAAAASKEAPAKKEEKKKK